MKHRLVWLIAVPFGAGMALGCGTEKQKPQIDAVGLATDACCGAADTVEDSSSAADAFVQHITTADASTADARQCECSVGSRRCGDTGGLNICGSDCRWHFEQCDSGRCIDGVCCECRMGDAECTLDDTAQRTCEDGCSWALQLCAGICRDGACCELCARNMKRCASRDVYEYCNDEGCLVTEQCNEVDCPSVHPHAPFGGCDSQWWDNKKVTGCFCHTCLKDADCQHEHTLGVRCGKIGQQAECMCEAKADCVGKTAGPRCNQGLCGCFDQQDCPEGESCVPSNNHTPVIGHQVCSGNPLWPRQTR